QSATFTAASGPRTDNIISRVTGTSASYIDGALRSTVPGADVWLMNPNGVFFNEGATVDIQGGLHVTTADYLAFPDGARFDTNPQASSNSLLSSAPPSAFGFLDGGIGNIYVVTESISAAQISLVGGNVQIDFSSFFLPGLIRISSVAGAGELGADPHDVTSGTIDLFGSTSFAFTDMSAGELYIESSSLELFDTNLLTYQSSDSSGDLLIKADDIGLIGSRLDAGRVFRDDGFFGDGEILFALTGGNLGIEGLRKMGSANSIANSITTDDSHISTYSESDKTGHINLRADTFDISNSKIASKGSLFIHSKQGLASERITISGNSSLTSDQSVGDTFTELRAEKISITDNAEIRGAFGSSIFIFADDLSISGTASIKTDSNFFAIRGDITVAGTESSQTAWQLAGSVDIEGNSESDMATISSSAFCDLGFICGFSGIGGNINIVSDQVRLGPNGLISTDSLGSGSSNIIRFQVNDLLFDGGVLSAGTSFVEFGIFSAGILIAGFDDNDDGVTNPANSVVFQRAGPGGFNIDSYALNFGELAPDGGFIDIKSRVIDIQAGGISAQSIGDTKGGTINLVGQEITISGVLETSSANTAAAGKIGIFGDYGTSSIILDGGEVRSVATGSGDAGSILLTADSVSVANSSLTVETNGAGNSGSIELVSTEGLALENSKVTTEAVQGGGGSVNVSTAGIFSMENSVITATALGLSAEDSGGNVIVSDADFVVMNRSVIQANANAGAGGNIFMNTGALVQSADSFITATSQSNISGQVNVDTIDDITGTIVDLETPQTEMPEITESRCTPQALVKRSSLVVDEVSPQMTLDNSLVGNGLTPASQNPRLVLAGCSRK
ncbi:MAG: filamentous hemagglutinin N-terminal domain-containing protein, partial [Halioglobus sp.]